MTTYGKNLFVTDAVTDTSLIKKYEKIEISSLASVPTDTQNATAVSYTHLTLPTNREV